MKKQSKFLSYILRHNPDSIGVKMDTEGYVNVSELLEKLPTEYKLSTYDLETLVSNNDKKRFGYNSDKTKIRAEQGHSITVDIIYEKVHIDTLYHGTASKNIDSIIDGGLKPQNRNYVHLSKDIETATKVGQRHGKPVVFLVDCKGMDVYISVNGVYLTKYVDPDRLSLFS